MVSSSSSIRFLDQYSNQVRASSSPSFSKRNSNITVTPRYSKSQMCLHKILHIITSHQQQQEERSIISRTNGSELMSDDGALVHKDQDFMCSSKKRLLGIDLNLRLGRLFEESTSIEKSGTSSQGECEPKLVIEEEVKDRDFNGEDHTNDDEEKEKDKEEETNDDHSEITNLQFQGCEKDRNGNLENGQCQKHGKSETSGKKLKNEGFLGLLVEAARWVSENYCNDGGESDDKSQEEEEEEEEEEGSRVRGGRGMEKEGGSGGQKCNKSKILGSKRKGGCDNNVDVNVYVVEYEDDCMSPVVRSKRGRSQVLPVRYRDSVLEPWKKGFSRPPQRLVASCNNKRKSR